MYPEIADPSPGILECTYLAVRPFRSKIDDHAWCVHVAGVLHRVIRGRPLARAELVGRVHEIDLYVGCNQEHTFLSQLSSTPKRNGKGLAKVSTELLYQASTST